MAGAARLEADGLDPFIFNDSDLILQALDLGDADTREVVDDATDADGTVDTTELIGARTITMTVALVPLTGTTKEQLRRRLRAFTHPRLRPILYLTLDEGDDELRAVLRRKSWTNAHDNQPDAAVVIQFVVPSGVLESSVAEVVTVLAAGDTPPAGFTFPFTFPLSFPDAIPLGLVTVTNNGTADAYPVFRIFGPCTDPIIENVTTGERLVFDGLTINAGEYLEIDARPGRHTIRYQADPADSRYSTLDLAASTWFGFPPGDTVLRLNPATFSTPSQLEITFRHAYL